MERWTADNRKTVRFDDAYYARFYRNPDTRVYTQRRHAKLVAGVVSLIEWFGVELSDVLDVGAGLGWWGQWLARHRPKTRVLSTELEPDICQKYGHRQADIASFRLKEQFDLVVCQGVLPYLSAAQAEASIENLAAMCGGFLYLEAITKDDMKDAVDVQRTDLSMQLRSAAWYQKRLERFFKPVGAGLYASLEAGLPFFALETPRT